MPTKQNDPVVATPMATIRLLCARTGDGWTDNPGSVIEVDAEEAARLISMGAAEDAVAGDSVAAAASDEA